jgi:hypothetical protein
VGAAECGSPGRNCTRSPHREPGGGRVDRGQTGELGARAGHAGESVRVVRTEQEPGQGFRVEVRELREPGGKAGQGAWGRSVGQGRGSGVGG